MNIEITDKFKIVTADEGKLLHNEDTYAPIIYMPFDGDISIWEEVDESECDNPMYMPEIEEFQIYEEPLDIN